MARPKLTLFLDVISPFAYIAFYVTKTSPVFKQCDVTYVPIFLGGVMKSTGNRPPLEIKLKDKWIDQERRRWQKAFSVPMLDETPKPFPQPTLNTQRVLCAIELKHPDRLVEAFDALYHGFWVEGKAIGKPENIEPALAKVFNKEETKNLMEAMKSAEAKDRLSKNSDWAMAEGAFGLPYFVATNAKGEKDTQWGIDHLGLVVDHLGLERKSEAGFRSLL